MATSFQCRTCNLTTPDESVCAICGASSQGDRDPVAASPPDVAKAKQPFVPEAKRVRSIDILAEAISFKSTDPEKADAFELLFQDSALSANKKAILDHVFFRGLEEASHLRPLIWKLVFRYLDWSPPTWRHELGQRRREYAQFVQELVVNPFAHMDREIAKLSPSERVKVCADEDPLSAHSSEWGQFYADQNLRREIAKDVERTYATFSFFQQKVQPEVEYDPTKYRSQAKKQPDNIFVKGDTGPPQHVLPHPKEKEDETHHDCLGRILFIYAKLNPGIKYVQGMNEILAPIYFTFARDTSAMFRGHAEADSFYCFTAIMAEIRDRFMQSLDSSDGGVMASVTQLNSLLHAVDLALWEHLEALRVDPRYYSFRWITLLLSQEFQLPDVIRLWDTLFADEERWTMLNYSCVAMVVVIRDRLLQADFAKCMHCLQQYEEMDVDIQQVVNMALHIRQLHPPYAANRPAEETATTTPGTSGADTRPGEAPLGLEVLHKVGVRWAEAKDKLGPKLMEGKVRAQRSISQIARMVSETTWAALPPKNPKTPPTSDDTPLPQAAMSAAAPSPVKTPATSPPPFAAPANTGEQGTVPAPKTASPQQRLWKFPGL